jgi:hypothetical protein
MFWPAGVGGLRRRERVEAGTGADALALARDPPQFILVA